MTPSRKIVFTGKMPWLSRAVTVLLIPVNLLAAVPPVVVAAAISPAPVLIHPPASAFAAQVPSVAPHPLLLSPRTPAILKFATPSADSQLSALSSQLHNPPDADLITARCFEEPLVPQSGNPLPNENADFAQALLAFHKNPSDLTPLTSYLAQHPASRWNASLLTNLGLLYRNEGRWSKALSAFEQAWSLGKDGTTALQKAVADRTLGELAQFYARVGHTDQLEVLLNETKGLDVRGAGTERLSEARSSYAQMKNDVANAFRCGPLAVGRVFQLLHPGPEGAKGRHEIHLLKSTAQGTNLADLQNLMNHIGLAYQAAFRMPGALVPVPSIVHWKLGHYSALIKKMGDNYLARDTAFGTDTLLSSTTLDVEASGYFLVPAGPLPPGWRAVADNEAKTIFGKGSADPNPTPPPPCDQEDAHSCPDSGGMAQYNLELASVCLLLKDTPVGYAPPVGPAVYFSASYNHRESADMTNISNLGNKWCFNWLGYLQVTLTNGTPTAATVFGPGGGQLPYTNYNPTTGTFAPQLLPQLLTQDNLVANQSSPNAFGNIPGYTVYHKDGSEEIYNLSDGSVTPNVFRTQSIDPQGNAITYGYDSHYRLMTVTDALNQTTTISYGNSTDSANPAFYNITQVTDPFQRFATFQYNSIGQLIKITDILGITSQFAYGTGDFINSLTTPYGTTQFAGADVDGYHRWLEATDPLGAQERVEFNGWGDDPISAYASPIPSAFVNGNYSARDTFYWDKEAMSQMPANAPIDYTKARITHFLHDPNTGAVTPVVEATKQPFENWVFNAYAGQTDSRFASTSNEPVEVIHFLGNTEQDYNYQYNANGNVTQSIDPLGRETEYVYDLDSLNDPTNPNKGLNPSSPDNGIDLLYVLQKNGSSYDILAAYSYNLQHLPLTATDASGQVTKYAYNAAGQVSTITDAKNEVTSFYYDPAGAANTSDLTRTGYLVTVVGPAVNSPTGPATTFTYDTFGRVNSVTLPASGGQDSENYTVAATYDNFDRPLTITYPDGTYNQILYNRLDAEWIKDRRGRWTHQLYDANQHLVVQEDPLGRKTSYDWCNCGALAGITDPAGNTTTWMRDPQSRITQKIYPDGSSLNYAYETTTSRLKSVTDALNQVTNYAYNIDNSLNQVSYTNAVNPTPTVGFTYDPNYLRIASMTDGTGTTNYAYYPVPASGTTTGANQLYTVTGPLANSTIAYTYDELGRVLSTSINGSTNMSSVQYDALGRVTTATNPLGTFNYGYVDQTNRLNSVAYPNGQVTNYGYYPNSAATPGNDDQRLQSITNLSTTGSNLSTFNYTYDPEGIIQTWAKQLDSGSQLTSTFGYDSADQLISASVPSVPSVVQNYSYNYDLAGNRLTEQIGPSVTTSAFNNLNQLTGQSPGGLMQFTGTVNEPATVTVGGNPATVTASSGTYDWQGTASVTSGTNSIPLAGTDANGHQTQSTIHVTVSGGAAPALAYDANGNLTNDGNGKVYAYDAANRLISVTQNGTVTGYVYDGNGYRVQETSNGAVVKQWVWCPRDAQPCEERDGSNNVTKRFYRQGEQINGTAYFETKDHLKSVRELINANGSLVARYDYDPYGRRTLISGTDLADFGFTGFYYDQASGLWFSQSRAYDPNLARWLSRDPIGEAGGINLYAYVSNNPTDLIDPSGLAGMPPNSPPFPVPGGGPGNGWKWNPNPKYDPSAPSSRPGSYGPEEPVPNPQGGQPITSWDDQTPNPHWDLNDGNGNKSWMDNKGNPITSDDAHGRCPPKEEPEPEPKPKVPWWAPFELPGEFLGPWIFIPPGYHTPGKPDLNRQA